MQDNKFYDPMIAITYLPKTDLCYLNKKAKRLNLNRQLNQVMLEALPEHNNSPVHFSVPVDDARIIRANIEIIENVKGVLDILIEDFNKLPQAQLPSPN